MAEDPELKEKVEVAEAKEAAEELLEAAEADPEVQEQLAAAAENNPAIRDLLEDAIKKCEGAPPQDLKYAVCNTETGEWEDGIIVINDANSLEPII